MSTTENEATRPPPVADARSSSPSSPDVALRTLAYAKPEDIGIDLGDPARRRFGNYELLELLGRGGMGAVYRARQLDLDRDVAVKFLAAGPWASAEFITRFRSEARAAARMQHPNIVEVYETGERDGLYFFSMRLVSGPTLADIARVDGPLAPERAARLLRTIAEAIDYAHRLGVLHLDLKPGNVLLSGDTEPLVADFGLARRVDEGPHGDGEAVSGTPSYMSPEQAQARTSIGPAADIYGLGAILYELLVGAPPFKADSAQETMRQVVFDTPVAPRRYRTDLPKDLEAICLKCLDKEPARRYASAGTLADDLRRFIEGEPVIARAPNLVERGARWVARNRAAALAGVLLVAGVVGTTDQMLRANEARREAEAQRANATRMMTLIAEAFPVSNEGAHDVSVEQAAERIVRRLEVELPGRGREQQAVLMGMLDSIERVDNPNASYALLRAIVTVLGEEYRREAAEAQIARGTARGKILGAILLHTLETGADDLAAEARKAPLIAEALAMAPDDRDVLVAAAYYCGARNGPCAGDAAAQQLAELEPDNAANWILAMKEGEPDAARYEKLARAAGATRIDDHIDRVVSMQFEAVQTSRIEPPPLLQAASARLTPEITPQENVAYMQTWSMPIPRWNNFALTCRPDHLGVAGPQVRAQCLAAGTRAAYEARSLIGTLIGSTVIRHAAPGSEAALRAREVRRSYSYTTDAMSKLTPEQSRRAKGWLIARELRVHGELEAFKRMLDRAGVPRDPPIDWAPENPEHLMTSYERELFRAKKEALAKMPLLEPIAAPSPPP